ncbi:MAG: hypothetical protein MUD06_00745 [Rhodospirillales bacterium]|jgi:hypothetical protein|nr:hypothetical protein [Rhodospirillales bacterium]
MTDCHLEDEQPAGLAIIDGFSVCRRIAGARQDHAAPGTGSRSPAPSRDTSHHARQHSASPLYRATFVHVCLMLLAVANITSGIVIANQQYERLPAPLLVSVFLSFICAWLQSAGEQRSDIRNWGDGVRQ